MSDAVTVLVGPERDEHLVAAVADAGARLVDDLADAQVLVWIGGPDEFPALPDSVEWVALSLAGIESFLNAGVLDDRRIWTNASGFYAAGVAEHALALLLAGVRKINTAVTTMWAKDRIDPAMGTLRGSTVAIVGAGGIGRELTPMLNACGARVIAVNRSGRPVDGAAETVAFDRTDDVLSRADHVVLAAPNTAETHKMIDDRTLALLKPHSWIVNVARGPLIDQAALGRALADGVIAGAALDVTDPEPPAQDDPLWGFDNVIITPHVANPASSLTREMAPYLAENLRRFAAGEELLALVEPGRGY